MGRARRAAVSVALIALCLGVNLGAGARHVSRPQFITLQSSPPPSGVTRARRGTAAAGRVGHVAVRDSAPGGSAAHIRFAPVADAATQDTAPELVIVDLRIGRIA